ncbi:unnamed protein product, partial [Allacma fusca]
MKASDEEDYGSFYTQRSSNVPRYNRYREYSPNRSHHQSSSSSNLGDPSPYMQPSRSYNRTPPYGTNGRNIVEYAPPPCCHQFYHPPPPPVPLHPSPSHFNTVPHPPLQYRDVPACATLNRSCITNRRQNPYSSYYTSESPYGDPRSEIYYTSTLTRHPRHSSSSRGYPSDNSDGKIYESASVAQGYHHGSTGNSSNISNSSSRPNYGSIGTSVSVSIGAVGAANSGIGNN